MGALIVLATFFAVMLVPPAIIFRKRRENKQLVAALEKINDAVSDPEKLKLILAEVERQRALKATTPLRNVRSARNEIPHNRWRTDHPLVGEWHPEAAV